MVIPSFPALFDAAAPQIVAFERPLPAQADVKKKMCKRNVAAC